MSASPVDEMAASDDAYENLSLGELIELWQVPADHEGEWWDYLDEIAWRIAQKGQAGAAFLVSQLSVAGAERLPSLIEQIADSTYLPLERKRDLLRPFLGRRDDPRILRAAIEAATWREGDTDVRELIEPYVAHPDHRVRASAVQYMARHFEFKSVPVVRAALADTHPVVRQYAAGSLAHFEDGTLVESLLSLVWPLLDDADSAVRWYARDCLLEHVFRGDMATQVVPNGEATEERIRAARCDRFLSDARYPGFLAMFTDAAAVVRLVAVDCILYLLNWEDHADDLEGIWEDAHDPLPVLVQDPEIRVRKVAQEIAERLGDRDG